MYKEEKCCDRVRKSGGPPLGLTGPTDSSSVRRSHPGQHFCSLAESHTLSLHTLPPSPSIHAFFISLFLSNTHNLSLTHTQSKRVRARERVRVRENNEREREKRVRERDPEPAEGAR
jgi:hypothetical protein